MDNGTIDEIIIEVDNLMMEMEIEIIIEEDQIIIINNQEEDHVGLSPCVSQIYNSFFYFSQVVVDMMIHIVVVNDHIMNIIEVEVDIEVKK
jgi:hypothetical protein